MHTEFGTQEVSISSFSDITQVVMEEGIFLTVLEVNLMILCNSMPMLLPLYSYWRYRRFFGAGEDQYVSQVAGDGQPLAHDRLHRTRTQLSLLKDVTNGIPLETIYGKEDIHFTSTVSAGPGPDHGPSRSHTRPKSKRGTSRPSSERSEDNWDAESTRRLPRHMGPTGTIKIETEWTITEENRKDNFRDP